MEQRFKKQEGITLIALVVTIIVLLILAGISISMLAGENGIINRAGEAKEKTEEAGVKETIALSYVNAISEKYISGGEIEQALKNELENIYGVDAVIVTQKQDGKYVVYIENKGTYEIDANGNIEKANPKPEYEIAITQENGNDLEEDTRYEKVLVTIKVTNTRQTELKSIKLLDSLDNNLSAKNIDITDGTATFEVSKNMTYTALVEGKSLSSEEKVKINCVTLATLDRYKTEGKIDIVWLDEDNNIISTPIAPNLQGNMKKLTFDSTSNTFVEATSNDWYAYNSVTLGTNTTSKWANAQTTDGSMWVWIPRYAYKITYYDTDGTTEIGYSCSRGIVTVDGDVVAENNEGIETVEDYIVHPAFTSSAENGGGFGEISGFWFAKFETSGSLTAGTGFKSVAGENCLTHITIGDFYKYARQQLYGETGTVDALDNYTSFGSSHMVKNSEWGAVAYLTQSSYGTNSTKVQPNSLNNITGQNSATVYTDNVTQSTTHNPYGVYDMNGTSWEYMASYVNSGDENLSAHGVEMTRILGESTKYKTVYPSTTTTADESTQSLDYELNNKLKGDAVYETSRTYEDFNAWFAEYSYFPCANYPFFSRGGGIFCYNRGFGRDYGDDSCRLALVF